MIENGIGRFDIAQQIDQRDLVALRTRQRAHDEVEIGGGEPRPTIRPDHRELIMRDGGAYGKQDSFASVFRECERHSGLRACAMTNLYSKSISAYSPVRCMAMREATFSALGFSFGQFANGK